MKGADSYLRSFYWGKMFLVKKKHTQKNQSKMGSEPPVLRDVLGASGNQYSQR